MTAPFAVLVLGAFLLGGSGPADKCPRCGQPIKKLPPQVPEQAETLRVASR